MFLLDSCAVLALLRWRPRAGSRPGCDSENPNRQTVLIFCGNIVCLGILAAWWMTRYVPTILGTEGEVVGVAELVVLTPEEWIGKRLPLLRHLDVATPLSSGQWRVVLYHHDCAKCREIIPSYEQMAAAAGVGGADRLDRSAALCGAGCRVGLCQVALSDGAVERVASVVRVHTH